jgi:hypothetical protein
MTRRRNYHYTASNGDRVSLATVENKLTGRRVFTGFDSVNAEGRMTFGCSAEAEPKACREIIADLIAIIETRDAVLANVPEWMLASALRQAKGD